MEAAKPFKVTMLALKTIVDEDGNIFIRGLGGDAEPDYDPKVKRIERLSIDCIRDMIEQVRTRSIPLIPRHWERGGSIINDNPEWDDELGVVVDLIVNPYGQMFPLIKLDMDNHRAQTLFNQVERKKKKLALSWGGKPLEWHTEIDAQGMEVRVFDKIELWHFAVTTRPVNNRTLNYPLAVVAKAVDWQDAETVKTDCAVAKAEFEKSEEIQAICKSFKEMFDEEISDEKASETNDNELEAKSMPLTPEELKAFNEGIVASVKASIEPLHKEIEALKSAIPEPKKPEMVDKTAVDKMIADAVKSALESRDGEAAKAKEKEAAAAALKPEEVKDMIATAVNDAMKSLSSGLKSQQDAENGKPGSGDDGETEVSKAFKSIQIGEKGIDDFPEHIQRKLEDFSAKAYSAIEAKMPSMHSAK